MHRSAADAWIRSALEAGQNPEVVVQQDGRRALCMSEVEVDREKSPGAVPEEIIGEIVDRLIVMGRGLPICECGQARRPNAALGGYAMI